MNREVKCTSKGKRRLKPLLTPREQTLYRNRFNYFKRIDRENALDRTLKWFEAWYRELTGHEPPEDYREEVLEFLLNLERKQVKT